MIKPGQTLRTISKQRNVLAKATITETFSDEFVIFDLNRFLGVITSLEAPEINMTGKKLHIKSGDNQSIYGLSDESMIIAAPEKDLKIENAEVIFTLSRDQLVQVLKLSGIMNLPNVAVIGDGKKITFVALNVADNESDTFVINVGTTDVKFKSIFNTENLKMIEGNYTVSISFKGISHFKNNSDEIEYWIATEAGSIYGGEI